MDLGHTLENSKIKAGLLELNKDLAFDVVTNRPTDWNYVFVLADPRYRNAIEQMREPVLYRDKYIVSLDRGPIVPEVKTYAVTTRHELVDAEPHEPDVIYSRTVPGDFTYPAQLAELQAGNTSYQIAADGIITHWQREQYTKVLGKVQQVGWRHTFENLITADIPGITRAALGLKFGVDMYKTVHGPRAEVVAALRAE